jgi:hypothetical protein
MPVVIADLEQDYIGGDVVQSRFEEIKKSVQDLVDVYFKQVMREEMDRLNSQIDTPEEYSSHKIRVAACEERRNLERKKPPKTELLLWVLILLGSGHDFLAQRQKRADTAGASAASCS